MYGAARNDLNWKLAATTLFSHCIQLNQIQYVLSKFKQYNKKSHPRPHIRSCVAFVFYICFWHCQAPSHAVVRAYAHKLPHIYTQIQTTNKHQHTTKLISKHRTLILLHLYACALSRSVSLSIALARSVPFWIVYACAKYALNPKYNVMQCVLENCLRVGLDHVFNDLLTAVHIECTFHSHCV